MRKLFADVHVKVYDVWRMLPLVVDVDDYSIFFEDTALSSI